MRLATSMFRAMVVWLCIATAVRAQSLLWDRVSAPPLPNQFGVNVWAISDVDDDQVRDLLIGMPGSASYAGILSGATGNTIAEYFAPQAQGLRPLGPVGDVNGDGRVDFLITYLPSGASSAALSLVSGNSGAILATLPYGADLCSPIGDVNGDGFGDFAIAFPNVDGWIEVYHGPGFNFAYAAGAQWANSSFGRSIAPCGDVNGDGVQDFIVGAPGVTPTWPPITVPGFAYVLSGVDGSVLRSWTGPFVGSKFGTAVVSPGDLDLDGVPDIIVSAPGSGAVSLYAFSGATGSQIGYYADPLGWADWFGMQLVAVGDVDGDGIGDFAARGHYADIFSGATMTPIYTIPTNLPATYPNGYQVAIALAGLPDADGDSFPEIVVGAPAIAFAPVGHIQRYSLRPQGITVVGSGCPQSNGAVARIGATGVAHANSTFQLNLSNVAPGLNAGLILGSSNTNWGSTLLPLQLNPPTASGCVLRESIDWFVMTTSTSVPLGPLGGRVTMPLAIPSWMSGVTFYSQWAVYNPPGSGLLGSLTAGLAITVQ